MSKKTAAQMIAEVAASFREDAEIAVSRREMLADFIESHTTLNSKDMKNVLNMVQKAMSKFPEQIAEIMAMKNSLSAESASELTELSVKLNGLISGDGSEFDDKDKKFRFITSMKRTFANFTDEEVKAIYNANNKLVALISLV